MKEKWDFSHNKSKKTYKEKVTSNKSTFFKEKRKTFP